MKKYLLITSLLFSTPAMAAELTTGIESLSVGDYATAVKNLQPLAMEGNPEAEFRMCGMYYLAQGVPKNDQEAANYCHSAAVKGHVEAMYNLALMYQKGEGVRQDYNEATKWYAAASSKGHMDASYNLNQIQNAISMQARARTADVPYVPRVQQAVTQTAQIQPAGSPMAAQPAPPNFAQPAAATQIAMAPPLPPAPPAPPAPNSFQMAGLAPASNNPANIQPAADTISPELARYCLMAAQRGNPDKQCAKEFAPYLPPEKTAAAPAAQPPEVAVASPAADEVAVFRQQPIIENQPPQKVSGILGENLKKNKPAASAQAKPKATQETAQSPVKPVAPVAPTAPAPAPLAAAKPVAQPVQAVASAEPVAPAPRVVVTSSKLAPPAPPAPPALMAPPPPGQGAGLTPAAAIDESVVALPSTPTQAQTPLTKQEKIAALPQIITASPALANATQTAKLANLAPASNNKYKEGQSAPADGNNLKWYIDQANSGNALAQNNLGVLYRRGQNGADKNPAEALKWFERAAAQGSSHGMLNLASMYKEGEGTKQNLELAYAWYNLAADRVADPVRKAKAQENVQMIAKYLSNEQIGNALTYVTKLDEKVPVMADDAQTGQVAAVK